MTTQSTNQPNQPTPAPRGDDLAAVAKDALRIWPPDYFSAIFGRPWTWRPPFRRFSEYRILSPWRPRRALRFLRTTWVPSMPRTPLPFNPPFLNDLFWQPTVILQRPDHNGSYTSYPEEHWFLINGIMTNDSLTQVNAALVAELFHRPLTLIQNSTNSLLVDLYQCALDKEGAQTTEAVVAAFPAIYDALKSPYKGRVVVIAHSQGTIIAAAVLRLLQMITPPTLPQADREAAEAFAPPEFVYPTQAPLKLSDFDVLDQDELAKLEIYGFATCATVMQYFEGATGSQMLPHLEHFGNENDIVARLGMQAPAAAERGVRIDGARYVRPGAWGHLLNEHYLYPIADHQRRGRRQGGDGTPAPFELVVRGQGPASQAPRLFSYLNGGNPVR